MSQRHVLALAVAALAATLAAPVVTAPNQEALTSAPVLDRFVQYAGEPVHLRFDAGDRSLVVVGEADRPFVYLEHDRALGVWWTTLADLREAPELEYLLREQARRISIDPERDVLDLPESYRTDPELALVPMQMGTEATGRVNSNPGDTDPLEPSHYRQLNTLSPVRPYLLVNADGRLDLVIPATALDSLVFDGEAEGDGGEQRLGGLRLDLVFYGTLDLLPPDSMQWLGPIGGDSLPLRHYRIPQTLLNAGSR